jgi:hypothetical protein
MNKNDIDSTIRESAAVKFFDFYKHPTWLKSKSS